MADQKNWIAESVRQQERKGTTGSFTRIAHAHGKEPKEMASAVTSNPDAYSEKTRRKAQWLVNISK